ncbi:MAG: hypothetical protein RIM99_16985 [Cyclobacteriaceae bacterium]
MGKVKINQGRSIPWAFRLVATAAIIVGVVKIIQGMPENYAILLSMILSMLMPIIWFSYNILTIDNDKKEIHSGVYSVGFKTGKAKKFKEIDKIFINKVKTSQRMQSHGTGSVYEQKGVEYRAFIKLDDGTKYFLTSHPNEKKLEEKVTKIREKLGTN